MSTINKEALQWVARQSARELDETEREALAAWLAEDIRHEGAYLRATVINQALDLAMIHETLRPKPDRLQVEWADASWKRGKSRRAFLMYGGIAAGAAIFATGTLFKGLGNNMVLTTAKGEFRKVPLADKSLASINSGSEVEVRLTDQARKIKLKKGEAWFEVAKDKAKPFIVDAGEVQARAVGTAFGVRRFSNGVEILVTEGVVEVSSKDGIAQKRLLTAGESTFVSNRESEISVTSEPAEVQRKLAWREGKLVFNNQTLKEAVADFNRYSSRKIIIVDRELMNRTLIGQYPIDEPELFAKDVSTFLDVPIVITADEILIG
jgi:transmembrane sensor